MRTDQNVTIYLKDYQPCPYEVLNVDMTIDLNGPNTLVTNRTRYQVEPDQAPCPMVLNGEDVILKSIAINDEVLDDSQYLMDQKSLTLTGLPDDAFDLTIVTQLDPKRNTKLSGLYRSSGIYCTQCEAEGFRRITYYYDRPDVMSIFTVRLEADQDESPILLANGNLVDSGKLDNNRHFSTWHDPHKKPAYLFAVVGGKLDAFSDRFTTMSGQDVELNIYVEPGKQDRCAFAMEALKASMKWDEDVFGREYDLDIFNIVAVSDFNMGAMENKGLNIFNDALILAAPDTATDSNYMAIERVVAHEYFHNWTGNRITCRDWFQLCLKEGLTVFRDQEFTADMHSRPVKRINDARMLRTAQFAEDGGPLAHPVRPDQYSEINNFYTLTIYEKGAELVRMLKTIIGEQDFKAGMDLYFDRHDGQAVTIEDFIACFDEKSPIDLSQFFLWYQQSGTPEVHAVGEYDATEQTYSLHFEQKHNPSPGQNDKKPMHIPIRIGLIDNKGKEIALNSASDALQNDVFHLRESKQSLVFNDISAPPIPSLLRNFSAPVYLFSNLTTDDQLFLLEHDTDAYNRWDVAQNLIKNNLLALIQNGESETLIAKRDNIIQAIGSTLTDDKNDPATKAQFLETPDLNVLAQAIGENVDPARIIEVITAFKQSQATVLRDDLLQQFEANVLKGPYLPNKVDMGKRSLRHAVLGILAAKGIDEDIEKIVQHYHTASNMTEMMQGLAPLAYYGHKEAQGPLDDFYNKFHNDPLVLDKWFILQALSPREDTLDTVTRLSKSNSFDRTNPNRIRALIGVFINNQVAFHRPDGKGHQFIGTFISELDRINPQIAARLLTGFDTWKRMTPDIRNSAHQTLKQLADSSNLSKDSTDIISRILT